MKLINFIKNIGKSLLNTLHGTLITVGYLGICVLFFASLFTGIGYISSLFGVMLNAQNPYFWFESYLFTGYIESLLVIFVFGGLNLIYTVIKYVFCEILDIWNRS